MEYILPLPKWMGMKSSQPQCWHPTPAYNLSARLWIVPTADGVCREEGVRVIESPCRWVLVSGEGGIAIHWHVRESVEPAAD
jgi:hypothetical protein